MIYAVLSFSLQGVLMTIDEFFFHRRRGLPLWEKVGHPADTASVLAVYMFINLNPPSSENNAVMAGLALFSCLLITKDEFIHTGICTAGENWVHSILFLLHPICFWAAALVWQTQPGSGLLFWQVIIVSAFLIYQISYWGFFAKNK